MALERLLGEMPVAEFVQTHLHRVPLARPHGAREFIPLADWDLVERVLAQPGVDAMVARDGALREGAPAGAPGYAEMRRLHEEGWTLGVRNAEKHDPALARLAEEFRADFAAPINVHLYVTPPAARGFDWHYDAEDVFILQTRGSKEYRLRKNTVNPWPLEETLPRDMRFEREVMPAIGCTLAAGDWLYIPPGYWHMAKSAGETSISLAVGVMSFSALDVFDALRARLLHSIVWRQRLPPLGRVCPLPPDRLLAHVRDLFERLGEDLGRSMAGERFLREFLATHGWTPPAEDPDPGADEPVGAEDDPDSVTPATGGGGD